MKHEMQHADSPTWCKHCGAFDRNCRRDAGVHYVQSSRGNHAALRTRGAERVREMMATTQTTTDSAGTSTVRIAYADVTPEPKIRKVNCLGCGRKLTAGPDTGVRADTIGMVGGGLVFRATGNYGSALYDPMTSPPELLEAYVCDDCMKARGRRVVRIEFKRETETTKQESFAEYRRREVRTWKQVRREQREQKRKAKRLEQLRKKHLSNNGDNPR